MPTMNDNEMVALLLCLPAVSDACRDAWKGHGWYAITNGTDGTRPSHWYDDIGKLGTDVAFGMTRLVLDDACQ
jgi:hypothetical protein